MRTYVIDELAQDSLADIRKKLDEMEFQSALVGVYWLPIPERLYSALQHEHKNDCGPYVMALEMTDDSARLELLVRGQNVLHCACVGYAQPELEQHMMRYLDGLLEC